MTNMSRDEASSMDETEEGESTSSTAALQALRLSLNLLGENLSPVAVKASAAVDAVLPVLVGEFRQWKAGLALELQRYEERGNSKPKLLLTVLVLFLVAFHVELVQTCKALAGRGGALERWHLQWTLYYQAKQRQWHRKRRKKTLQYASNPNNPNPSGAGITPKSLASPTSTASTVEDSNNISHTLGRPLSPVNVNGAAASRGRLLLMMKNHSPLSPRTSPERTKVPRDAYGLPLVNTCRTPSMDMNKHYVPDPNSTLLDSHLSLDSPSEHHHTNASFHNQSTSTIASKDTRSTNTNHTTRTPTSHSHSTSRATSSDHNSANRIRRHRAHLAPSTKLYPPPESAPPLRRYHTTTDVSSPSSSLNASRRVRKKNNITSSAAGPLSDARRRMSTGAVAPEHTANPTTNTATTNTVNRTKSAGSGNHANPRLSSEKVARKMHPRSRSGNGAMTSTASQMYMARQPSHAPTRGPPHSTDAGTKIQPRKGSGGGAVSPIHTSGRTLTRPQSKSLNTPRPVSPINTSGRSLTNQSRGKPQSQSLAKPTPAGRNLSPMPNSFRSNPQSQSMPGNIARELSRQELGYE